ncbi:signal transduction histidine kinase [Gloeopeniophorella convolvens]|nr:signal transduction histidine kinase [Gloeopeniophorella convolvens]
MSAATASNQAAAAARTRGAIDRSVFQTVVALNDADSAEFAAQMVGTYLAQADSTLRDMDAALRDRDAGRLALLAGALQDTSGSMGAARVAAACAELRAAAERDADCGAAHTRLRAEYAAAKTWLARYIETGVVPED